MSLRKTIIFILTIFIFSPTSVILAGTNDIEVNLGVEGCNFNGICEPVENIATCPVDCTPPSATTSSSSGSRLPDIYGLSVIPEVYSATINWNTGRSTISTVKWGTTPEVKDGTTRNILFARNHKIELINLKPGMMYYFTIDNYDIYGNIYSVPPTYFFTKFLQDTSFPLNPTNVRASASEPGTTIAWTNPVDENFSYVRIMRHDDHFRGDPQIGKLIFEGNAEKFLDTNVIAGEKYFYSLFARNKDGRYSTGVGVAEIAFSKTPEIIEEEPVIPSEPTEMFSSNFFVHQYQQMVSLLSLENNVEVKNTESTIVDTNTRTFADDYLSVVGEDGRNIGQFFFSFNQDSGRYQSVVPPLPKAGTYTLQIFRYTNEGRKILAEGKILVTESPKTEIPTPFTKSIKTSYSLWFVIPLLVLLILVIFLIIRHRKTQQQ